MKLKQWKKKNRLTVIELPSGLTMRGKPVNVETLAFTGRIPQPLLLEIVDLAPIKGANGQPDLDPVKLAEKVGEIGQLIGVVVDDCLVEVLDEDDDENEVWTKLAAIDFVPSKELDDADQAYVFQWATKGAAQLRPFRPEQGTD